MFGAVSYQQLFNQQQLANKLNAAYTSSSDPGTLAPPPSVPPPPPMSFTPWLIGGALLGGALYLLFRD